MTQSHEDKRVLPEISQDILAILKTAMNDLLQNAQDLHIEQRDPRWYRAALEADQWINETKEALDSEDHERAKRYGPVPHFPLTMLKDALKDWEPPTFPPPIMPPQPNPNRTPSMPQIRPLFPIDWNFQDSHSFRTDTEGTPDEPE